MISGDIDPKGRTEEFRFGKDGKPFLHRGVTMKIVHRHNKSLDSLKKYAVLSFG